MRLALRTEEIHRAGAEVAAVSVNEPERQAGMAERWKLTHFSMISDPGGEKILQPLDLFDPEERGGIALPGMIIQDPDGNEVYRYQGRDFADRTNDDDLFDALNGLALPPVDVPPWQPEAEVPADLSGFFRTDMMGPYFRGNFFGAIAIGGRVADDDAKAVAREHRLMAKATLDAWESHSVG